MAEIPWRPIPNAKLHDLFKRFKTWHEAMLANKQDDTPRAKAPDILQVKDMSSVEVLREISKFKSDYPTGGYVLKDIGPANQSFLGGRNVIKDSAQTSNPRSATQVQIGHVLDSIEDHCERDRYFSLRHLYYRKTGAFNQQSDSDNLLSRVCASLGCTRQSSNAFPSDCGVVIGPLIMSFTSSDKVVDCSQANFYGEMIPPVLKIIKELKSGAYFILLVEKYSAFLELSQAGVHKNLNCIMITGMGMADLSTRCFVKKLWDVLKLSVFALMDCDPFGFEITHVFRHGSKNMSYDSKSMATPSVYSLGILPSDLEKFPTIPRQEFSEADKDKFESLQNLKSDSVAWEDEVSIWEERKEKTAIEAVSGMGPDCLANYYLPYALHRRMNEIMRGIE